MHGCEKVLRIPWLHVCAPKHMDDCEPNSRAPFLTGRHGWLKIQSKCKQKLSNTHGWITNRPTQCLSGRRTDMWFVQNFTLSDFEAKTFTPSISHQHINSFSDKKHKNWVKRRNLHRWQKFYTAVGSAGSDEMVWDGEKSPTKKIKFGSFALQWNGLSGEKQDTAMFQGMVALQEPYN